MNNNETYYLQRTANFPLSFLLIFFIIFLSYYLSFITMLNSYPEYKIFLLPIQFLINLTFIYFSVIAISRNIKNNIFSKIKVTINLKNKDINFSQKKEISEENPNGFNFYATLTVKNKKQDNINKIKASLNEKIKKIFYNFLHDSNLDSIMAKEHWYRIAFSTLLYFIYLIFLIETINVGKEIFKIHQHETFHILVFFAIIYLSINKYQKLKKYESIILFSAIIGIIILSFIHEIKFNENYSLVLMFISFIILIYITYLPISLIQPNTKYEDITKDKLDKHFLIDIYFNKNFLYYKNPNLKTSRSMKQEVFYILIGLVFSVSLPIIINEIKTPSIKIEEQLKGKSING